MSRILFSVALAVGLAVSAQAQTCDELKAKINTYYDNIKTACGDNKVSTRPYCAAKIFA